MIMLHFTWQFFCITGNIETYLLLREMERDNNRPTDGKASRQVGQQSSQMRQPYVSGG